MAEIDLPFPDLSEVDRQLREWYALSGVMLPPSKIAALTWESPIPHPQEARVCTLPSLSTEESK